MWGQPPSAVHRAKVDGFVRHRRQTDHYPDPRSLIQGSIHILDELHPFARKPAPQASKTIRDLAPPSRNLSRHLVLTLLASVGLSSPPPQQMPCFQISLILALPPPRRQPDASLPLRHHSRRNDVPKIQLNDVRRHEVNLLQHMHPPLTHRHMARIRPAGLRTPYRRFHLHPVRNPILLHHQVIRSRISPQLRHPKPLLHRPRQKSNLRPLAPFLRILKLIPSLPHRRPFASKTQKARSPSKGPRLPYFFRIFIL